MPSIDGTAAFLCNRFIHLYFNRKCELGKALNLNFKKNLLYKNTLLPRHNG